MAVSKGLGKGLEAIIPGWSEETVKNINESDILDIKIEHIKTGVYQPRKTFNEETLKELARSIEAKGIIQPLVVIKDQGNYILIAGERRLRAAAIAGLNKVPVIVRQYSEEERLEIALIENLQREDLNAIEEAETYALLMEKHKFRQEDLAEHVNKSRSHVANILRLLSLSDSIKLLLVNGDLSSAKARTLLSEPDEQRRERLAKKAVINALSVKDIENLIRKKNPKSVRVNKELRQYVKELKEKFNQKFTSSNISLDVKENENNVKGDIKIKFGSAEELNKILDILGM
ncbi:MAG: ParB/RepB/Spo0J family partition protein [bacterium]|nr:ParB/RepB/Spo0J family partition protein [bacterium]